MGGILLPGCLAGLGFLGFAVAQLQSSNTTCADPSITWWNDVRGENPCDMAQTLFRRCFSSNVIPSYPPSPSSIKCSDPAEVACCSNSIAYSLVQACWSCQWGQQDPSPPNQRPTYEQYLMYAPTTSSGTLPSTLGGMSFPPWVYIPWNNTQAWNYSMAELNATQSLAVSGMGSTTTSTMPSSAPSTTSHTPSFPFPTDQSPPPPRLSKSMIIGATVGSIGGIIALIVLILLLDRKRRRRPQRVVSIKAQDKTRTTVQLIVDEEAPPPGLRTKPSIHVVTPFTGGLQRAISTASPKSPDDARYPTLRSMASTSSLGPSMISPVSRPEKISLTTALPLYPITIHTATTTSTPLSISRPLTAMGYLEDVGVPPGVPIPGLTDSRIFHSRGIRYEVEEDAGTWSEEIMRLPPRYSTVNARPPVTEVPELPQPENSTPPHGS